MASGAEKFLKLSTSYQSARPPAIKPTMSSRIHRDPAPTSNLWMNR